MYVHTYIHTSHTYTVSRKKNPLVFLIITPVFLGRFFILFVPMESRINTLQYTYLMAWWPVAAPANNSRVGLAPTLPSLLSLPFPSLPSPLFPSPLEVGLLNPARRSGERCELPLWAPPVRSGAKPQPTNDLIGAYLGQKEQLWWQQFYGFS